MPSKTEKSEKLTVLLAEDDPVVMHLMSGLLSLDGHTIIEAMNGREALSLWERERPHIILIDLQTSGMDGVQVTRAIRARERERGGQVPIYGMTGHAMEEGVNLCLEAGMTGHIAKPVDMMAVRQIIRDIKP